MSPTRSIRDENRTTTTPHRVTNWLRTCLSRGSPLRPTAGGGLALVLASLAVSAAAAGPLGDTLRIRWSVGTHYGPEYAPTVIVLAAFPALVALGLLGFRGLAVLLERADEFDETRGYYELLALGVLATLVLTQVAIVVANLP